MAKPEHKHESPSVPDVTTAVVVDGALVEGHLADPPVPWWSFTKTILAAAALALVDAGRLSLDTPLAGRRYTLRQLLQHRAGLSDYGALRAYREAVARGDVPWTVAELLERVSVLRTWEPETVWLYSNIGYLFVRQLIERTTGETIGAAVARLVLAPLDIAEARFATMPDDLNATRWGNAGGYDPGWVYHGLMIGPPAAAALALDRLLRGSLLPPALLHAMREPFPLDVTVPVNVTVQDRPWRAPNNGLGLMIDIADGSVSFLGHSGQDTSSTAAVYHFPTRRPCVTAAAFAPLENEAVVEHRVVEISRGLQGM
jgi:D-alanyl-D-alanine carboxypeptidase